MKPERLEEIQKDCGQRGLSWHWSACTDLLARVLELEAALEQARTDLNVQRETFIAQDNERVKKWASTVAELEAALEASRANEAIAREDAGVLDTCLDETRADVARLREELRQLTIDRDGLSDMLKRTKSPDIAALETSCENMREGLEALAARNALREEAARLREERDEARGILRETCNGTIRFDAGGRMYPYQEIALAKWDAEPGKLEARPMSACLSTYPASSIRPDLAGTPCELHKGHAAAHRATCDGYQLGWWDEPVNAPGDEPYAECAACGHVRERHISRMVDGVMLEEPCDELDEGCACLAFVVKG